MFKTSNSNPRGGRALNAALFKQVGPSDQTPNIQRLHHPTIIIYTPVISTLAKFKKFKNFIQYELAISSSLNERKEALPN